MDHAAVQKRVKGMTNDALSFARNDLLEVIEIQEESNRKGYHVPKLGDYWDELGYVLTEINLREKREVGKMSKRVDIKAILADPEARKEMFIRTIISLQAVEGIDTTREQAERAYEKILADEKKMENS